MLKLEKVVKLLFICWVYGRNLILHLNLFVGYIWVVNLKSSL